MTYAAPLGYKHEAGASLFDPTNFEVAYSLFLTEEKNKTSTN
jgi:hypothetical protein